MSRLVALTTLAVWLGSTLVLSEIRWFRRLALVERVEPFVPGGGRLGQRSGNRSLREVFGPLATTLGARLARGVGVSEELERRLERIAALATPAEFRMRQLGHAALALGGSTALAMLIGAGAPATLGLLLGAPLLAFLVAEHRLARASEEHQRVVFAELPVVAEQFGMLVSSGFSLAGALDRLADRGNGAIARDLTRVMTRIRHGVAPDDALREWAAVVDVAEVHQFVTILLLHDDTGDLGSLVSQEARSARRESQRRLIERIERRNEQVWIPVTVATLVPGVIFLAIPFTDALRSFGALS